MWPWTTFKDETIKVLKMDYLLSVLAVFLATIVVGFASSLVGGIVAIPGIILIVIGFGIAAASSNGGIAALGILLVVLGYILAFALAALCGCVIQSLLNITYVKLFTNLKQNGRIDMNDLLYVFNSGNLKNILKVSFKKNLIVALWSLLFVIPGIYKAYQLFMVEYLLAVNPNISFERARDISLATTNGDKLNIFLTMFVAALIGSLGSFVFGFGVYFTMPITFIVMCEVYHYLGTKALSTNAASNIEIPTI